MNKQRIIDEIIEAQNKLRTDPTYYVSHLEKMMQCFEGRNYRRPGYATLVTKEGAKAVQEAIEFLNTQEPLHALKVNQYLSQSSQDHADDASSNGSVGVVDSDGSTMTDRIERYCEWTGQVGESCCYKEICDGGHEIALALLIDDGVSNKANRSNLFNPKFYHIGIALANHPVYGQICVIDYATTVTKLPSKAKPSPKSHSKLGFDYSTPYIRKKLSPKQKVGLARSGNSKPAEGKIMSMDQVPKSIRDRISKEVLEGEPEIRYQDGTYKITYEKPRTTYRRVNTTYRNNIQDDDFFEKIRRDHGFKKFDTLGKLGDFGDFGDLEKFEEPETLRDINEPKGYIEKSTESNVSTKNGKTTKKVITTYKFADGSSKTLTNTKYY